MRCPYCQKEMEEGYVPVNSPFVLNWVSIVDKKKVRISDVVKLSEVAKIKNVQYCKLEFSGESPLTMRARCGGFRYFPIRIGMLAPGKHWN